MARFLGGVILLALSLIVGGCSFGSLPDASPRPDGIVGESGFKIELDGVTVTGPSAVAPAGTGVHLKASSAAVPSSLRGVESAAPAFDISMDGGVQPKQPVTVTLDLLETATPGHESLFFVTQRSDTGAWEGLPVTVRGNTASVTLDHFSSGWFGWGDQIQGWFIDQVKQLLKVGFKKPDCVGKSANVSGRDFSVAGDHDRVYPCVTSSHSSVVASIASNSPFVWRYRPVHGQGSGQQGTSPLELSGILTLALFDAMADYDYTNETVLVPGGKAEIKLASGVTDTWTGARVDAGLGLVAVLVGGLDVAAAMATGQNPQNWLEGALKSADKASKIREAAECMAGVVEGGSDPSGRLGEIANTVISCAGSLLGELVGGFIGGVIGTVVGIVTSLIGLLVTQVWGFIGELTNQNKVAMHVTSRASLVQLTGAGIGRFKFGASESDVLSFLTAILGKPTVEGGNGGCEMAAFGYQSYATFGDLRVRFAAADGSQSARTPRTMQSWQAELTSAQQGQLALSPEIPFGLSLEKLKAKYPDGGGLEHMGAWAAADVLLIPPEKVGGRETIHAGELDWCT